jgi:hypothetical protein
MDSGSDWKGAAGHRARQGVVSIHLMSSGWKGLQVALSPMPRDGCPYGLPRTPTRHVPIPMPTVPAPPAHSLFQGPRTSKEELQRVQNSQHEVLYYGNPFFFFGILVLLQLKLRAILEHTKAIVT